MYLKPQTIKPNEGAVAKRQIFTKNETELPSTRKEYLCLQSLTAHVFLQLHSAIRVIGCPAGRGSSKDAPIQWLPSDATNQAVYEVYEASWALLLIFWLLTKGAPVADLHPVSGSKASVEYGPITIPFFASSREEVIFVTHVRT